MLNNYDAGKMRVKLIDLISSNLNKQSKFYTLDYKNICLAVNKKSADELREALGNQIVINSLTPSYISKHCQVY